MDWTVFSICDGKAGSWLPPFFARSEGSAIRSLMNALSDVNSDFSKYPEDYTLYRIGTFNDDSGSLDGYSPVAVVRCAVLAQSVRKVGE